MNEMATAPLKALVSQVLTWDPLKREDDGDTFSYIDLGAVDQTLKAVTGARTLPCSAAPSRARQLVRADDVLVSTVRPNLNGVAMVPPELDGATASTGFCVIRAKENLLEPRYVFHWVRSPGFVTSMVNLATGASYPAVSDRIVLESGIPLPPIEEQRRIAAILDKANALRTKRRDVLAQLGSLAQSIFVEMFGGDTATTSGWPEVNLSDVADALTGFAFSSSNYADSQDEAVRLCRGANVMPGRLDWSDTAWWPRGKASDLAAFELREGDIVMAMDRPWISEGFKLARLGKGDCPSYLVQRVTRIRGIGTTNVNFLYQLLKQPEFTRHCKPTETTVPHISPKEIRSFRFNLPPISLQNRFSERIEMLSKIGINANDAMAESANLFSALQDRAFRGEL